MPQKKLLRPNLLKDNFFFTEDSGRTAHPSLLYMSLCRDRLECPRWPVSTAKSTLWHVSLRTGPWSNARRRLGLMNRAFLRTAECVCVTYSTWERHGVRMHYGKAVWHSGQCSAGKHLVLAFMWCHFETSHLAKRRHAPRSSLRGNGSL